MAKSRKQKKQPYTPPTNWDTGPNTQAQQAGKVIEAADYIDPETGKRINPNGVKRARRVDMLEVYHKRGVISTRGYTAGEKLQSAWEGTQRSPAGIENDKVQVSPSPGLAVTMQIDRISRLVEVSKKISQEHAALIEHVVIGNNAIQSFREKGRRIYLGRNGDDGKAALRNALDRLADRLGY